MSLLNKLKKILLFLLSFLIIIMSWSFIAKSIREFYLFSIKSTGSTKGLVLSSNKQSSWDGVSYLCQIEYNLNDKKNTFSEQLPDNIQDIISAGDTVKITYSLDNPLKATANSQSNHLFYLIASLAVIGFSVLSFIQLVFSNRRKKDKIK